MPLTPLIGRKDEIAAVLLLLARRRATRHADRTRRCGQDPPEHRRRCDAAGYLCDGTFFVDLAPLSDPELVLATIAQILEVKETGGQSLLQSVQSYLRDRHLLLLLDNFEQVLAAGLVVRDLLAASPMVTVLVTSREHLHLRGEHEVAIEPLALPDAGVCDPTVLTQYDAVRLFIDRAQAVKADFQVTNANVSAVAEICTRLDGLPLAIELAAARVKLLAPEALLARLSSRLQLLTNGQRDLPARQQTLRATIDWSYQLLEPEEQTLFRRLAVFEGQYTLDAVGQICTSEGGQELDSINGIQSLVDKSMVTRKRTLAMLSADQRSTELRFHMLETVRDFALEQLHDHGELEVLRHKHTGYYLLLAESAAHEIFGTQNGKWLDLLDDDHSNLRMALSWTMESQDIETAIRLCISLSPFWRKRSHRIEGYQWLKQVLSIAHDKPIVAGDTSLYQPIQKSMVAEAFRWAGTFAMDLGDFEEAVALHTCGLRLWRELGDIQGFTRCLKQVGWSTLFCGDYPTAKSIFSECIETYTHLADEGNLRAAWLGLGLANLYSGEHQQARTMFEQRLELERAQGLSQLPLFLGLAEFEEGHYDRAHRCFSGSLVELQRQGVPWFYPLALESLARVAVVVGKAPRAVLLFGAAHALRTGMHDPISPAERMHYYDSTVSALSTTLGKEAFARIWSTGLAMTLEQAIAYALEHTDGGKDAS